MKDGSSYKTIVKGTAIFGGVQVFNILINLIRGKFIAVLLGPTGMGVSSLLTSTVTTVQQISSLGLNLSAILDISKAQENKDTEELSRIITVVRYLLRLTGLLGAVILILFSSFFSRIAFGNTDYKWAFASLSLMLFFTTLANGEIAILKGCRRLKILAFSSLVGSSVGLVAGIPLYYFWGINGIAPALIILAVCTYLFNHYYSRKIVPEKKGIRYVQLFSYGKNMILLGIVSIIASLLGTLTNYGVNTFISNYGDISDVGLFQASTSLTNQYIGVVFTAMAVDYFPRLSAVSHDPVRIKAIVNEQSEIVLLIVAPLVALLILTAPLLIRLLLSPEFMVIVPVVRWMGFGILFKAISFPMGYISFSKGDKKMFFWLEGVIGNLLVFVLNITAYVLWGLEGLGISFVVSYILFFFIYIFVTRIRYLFLHNRVFIKLLIPFITLTTFVFLLSFWDSPFSFYITLIPVLILCILSYYQLNKRISIGLILKSKLRKK